jgi:hypothetical protein
MKSFSNRLFGKASVLLMIKFLVIKVGEVSFAYFFFELGKIVISILSEWWVLA